MKNVFKNKAFVSRLKYIVTLTVFGVIIIFFDQNNLIKRYRYARQIREMETEIQECKSNYNSNTMRLRMLQTNPRYIERIAREKYLMKKPDEDVFVIEKE